MSTETRTAGGRPNLVENGRFIHLGAEGLPCGWDVVRPGGRAPVMQVTVDREVTRAGGPTVRFRGLAGDTGVAEMRQALPAARAGATYRLSAWVKRQEVAEPRRSIGLRL